MNDFRDFYKPSFRGRIVLEGRFDLPRVKCNRRANCRNEGPVKAPGTTVEPRFCVALARRHDLANDAITAGFESRRRAPDFLPNPRETCGFAAHLVLRSLDFTTRQEDRAAWHARK